MDGNAHHLGTMSRLERPHLDGGGLNDIAVIDDQTLSVHTVSRKSVPRPDSVKINVEGAFIVNDDTQKNGSGEHVRFERNDIRLPHHTDVVSHVAVDVSL